MAAIFYIVVNNSCSKKRRQKTEYMVAKDRT
jgi:hypothetical protein